ncbi:LH1 [Barthadenovirus sternae]|nr:LH1 [Tern atadenovirus 1]
MSFRSDFGGTAFPFVTGALPTWPRYASPSIDSSSVYTISPDENINYVLSKYKYVALQPDSVYHWKNIIIVSSVIIDGRGSVIKLDGNGPIFKLEGRTLHPANLFVSFYNITFVGLEDVPDRSEHMQVDYLDHSAIWTHNAFKVTIQNCNFLNFKGAAVWFNDDNTYWTTKGWSQQHEVCYNRFQGCRIGIANSGASEYSIASLNLFYDCQICFYVIGGNWNRSSNMIVNCRSAYFHSKSGMWYAGSAGNYNAAHGSFTSSTLNHCDYGGNLWPTEFNGSDNKVYELAGMYFDDDSTYPPTWTGNTQYYGDMHIKNFKAAQKNFCIVGCTIMGRAASDENVGNIRLDPAIASKVYFIGCSGNEVVVFGGKKVNMIPDVFAVVK